MEKQPSQWTVVMMITKSPVPAGLIKVPLFTELPFNTFQKIGRLALWAAVFILEL